MGVASKRYRIEPDCMQQEAGKTRNRLEFHLPLPLVQPQIAVFGILIVACFQRNVVFCSEISNIIFDKQLTLSVVDFIKDTTPLIAFPTIALL